jgi:hypothetical protein
MLIALESERGSCEGKSIMPSPQERLLNSEDHYTERKSDQPKAEEVREAVVAFANSLPEGRTGVLYIDRGAKRWHDSGNFKP